MSTSCASAREAATPPSLSPCPHATTAGAVVAWGHGDRAEELQAAMFAERQIDAGVVGRRQSRKRPRACIPTKLEEEAKACASRRPRQTTPVRRASQWCPPRDSSVARVRFVSHCNCPFFFRGCVFFSQRKPAPPSPALAAPRHSRQRGRGNARPPPPSGSVNRRQHPNKLDPNVRYTIFAQI